MRRFGTRLRSSPKARKGSAAGLPRLEVSVRTLVFLKGGSGKRNKIFFQPLVLSDWGVKKRHKDKLGRVDFSAQAVAGFVIASPSCESG